MKCIRYPFKVSQIKAMFLDDLSQGKFILTKFNVAFDNELELGSIVLSLFYGRTTDFLMQNFKYMANQSF